MKFCPNCGAKVAPGDVFCTNCGAKLTSSSQINTGSTSRATQATQKPQPVKSVHSPKPQPASRPVAKQTSRKSGNWLKRHKAIVIVAAVVIIAVLGFAGVKHHQANSGVLANAHLTYSGSNGEGQADITDDSTIAIFQKVYDAIGKKVGLGDGLLEKIDDADSLGELEKATQEVENDNSQAAEDFQIALNQNSLTIEITPEQHLKNGETVTLKFQETDTAKKMEKEYGLDLSPKTYKVSGLQ